MLSEVTVKNSELYPWVAELRYLIVIIIIYGERRKTNRALPTNIGCICKVRPTLTALDQGLGLSTEEE